MDGPVGFEIDERGRGSPVGDEAIVKERCDQDEVHRVHDADFGVSKNLGPEGYESILTRP